MADLIPDIMKIQMRSFKDVTVHDLKELDVYLNKTNPSDFISYDKHTYITLDLYITDVLEITVDHLWPTIPNDIFMLDTVPLPDIVFKGSATNNNDKNDFWGRTIFIDGKLIVVCASNEYDYVTAVIVEKSSETECSLNRNDIYIKINNFATMERVEKVKSNIMFTVVELASHYIYHWYALQIMMLNPVIKDRLLTVSKKEKLRISESSIIGVDNSQKKKRKARYVKYKTISQVLIQSDILRKKHALCWYVIGHYRHYKDGRKTWVHGYWKGPMRELKKNLDEGRERLI